MSDPDRAKGLREYQARQREERQARRAAYMERQARVLAALEVLLPGLDIHPNPSVHGFVIDIDQAEQWLRPAEPADAQRASQEAG